MKMLRSKEGIAVILVLASLITNPLTGQYIEQGISWAFEQMFRHGSYISLIAGVYVIGLMTYTYIRADRLNIPTKYTHTKKAGKFIE